MSEDQENVEAQETATAGDRLLKPDAEVTKENSAGSQVAASPTSKPEVKYMNAAADSQNGDAKIDMENVRAVFAGMGKEELMHFANDPFWVRIRWVLFASFWLLWLAMLAGAIAIIVLAPRCEAPKPRQWWERSPLYDVNVRSFKDGSRMADGIGDFEGMRSKLDYIKDMGVTGVILTSIFPTSPSATNTESVLDFKSIHRDLGTVEEFKELVVEMKKKGLHVILDLVPNHSSKDHKWFQDSMKSISPYKDYYIWTDKAVGSAPNNWKSVLGGSAWEWSKERHEYYLHQFATDQPDLNFRNPAVVAEFKNIFSFWLDLGVSGFHLRKTAFLIEDATLRDELPGSKPGSIHDSYDFFDHKYTAHLHESLGLLGKWRATISNSSTENVLLLQDEFPLLHLTHVEGAASSMGGAGDLLQTPDFLLSLASNFSVSDLRKKIQGAIEQSPNHWPIWRLSSESTHRLASRFSPGLVDAMLMTTLLLPGTPIVLYGDEIGLPDVPSVSENWAIGPMQWNSSANAGFTLDSIKPWLEVSNPSQINVEAQLTSTESHYKTFKELVEARKSLVAIMFGQTNLTVLSGTSSSGAVLNDAVFAFTRTKSGNPGVLVVMNPKKETVQVDLKAVPGIAEELTVHSKSVGSSSEVLAIKSKVQRGMVNLPQESGTIFTFVYKDNES